MVLAVSPDRWTRRLGVGATGVLTLARPALVFGLVPFRVQAPVALGTFGGQAGWIVLTSRGQRGSCRTTSRLRQVALTAAAAPGVLGMFAVPVWSLRLGREPQAGVPEVSPAGPRGVVPAP